MAEALQKVHNTLSQMQKNLECSICLELLQDPVLTKCEHHFCNFCILSLLQSKKKGNAPCPLCKEAITKRGLIKHDSLKNIVNAYRNMVTAVEGDTGRKCTPPRGPVRFSQPEPPSQRPRRIPKKAAKKSNVRRGKRKGQPVMPIYLDEGEQNEIVGQSTVFKSNTNVRSSFPSSKETRKKSENKLPEDRRIEKGSSETSHVDQPMIIEVLASESLGEVTEGPDRTSSKGEQKAIEKGTVTDEQPNSCGSNSSKDPYEFIASQRTPRKIKIRHVKEKKKKPWEYSFGKISRKRKVVQAGGTQRYEGSQSDDDEENDSSLIHREDIDYTEEGEQILIGEQNGNENEGTRKGMMELESEEALVAEGEDGLSICGMKGVKDDDEDGEMGDGQVEVEEVQKEEVQDLKDANNSKRISRRDKRTLISKQLTGEGTAKRRSRDAAMKALDAIKGQSHSQSSGESIGTAIHDVSPPANTSGGNNGLVILQDSQECNEKGTEKPLDVRLHPRPSSPERGQQEMPLSQPPKLNRNHGDRLFATAYGKGKKSPPQMGSKSKTFFENLLLDDLPDVLSKTVDGDSEDERNGNEEVGLGDEGLPTDVENEHTIDMEEEAARMKANVIDLTDDGDEMNVEKEPNRDGTVENNEDMTGHVERLVKIPQESDSFVAEKTNIKSAPEVQNPSRSEISEISPSKASMKESSPNNVKVGGTGQEGQNGGGSEDGAGFGTGSGKKRQSLKERMRNKEGLTVSDAIDNPKQDHNEHLQSDWEFALKLAQELGSVPSNLKVSEKNPTPRDTEGRGRLRRMAQLKIQNGPEESEKKKRTKRNRGKGGQTTSKERAEMDVEIGSFNGDSKEDDNDENVGRMGSSGQTQQQGRKGKGRRLVDEGRIQCVPETPVVQSRLTEKPPVIDQGDDDENKFVGPPEDGKVGKAITKDGCFERGGEKSKVELDVKMVEGSKKVKAGRKGKARGRKMSSEGKQRTERKEDDVIEIVDEEKQEVLERKEGSEKLEENSDKNERRKSLRLCKDDESGKDAPLEKTKQSKKKGRERGSLTDEMSGALRIDKDVENIYGLGDEPTKDGAEDRKGNETKKSNLDAAVKDKEREEVKMKELKDHESDERNRRRRSSRLSKSQERETGNSETKAASQCETNKDRNAMMPGVVDEQNKGQRRLTRLSKSQESTQEKTTIAGRKRKLSQEPKLIDVDVQLIRLEEARQEVDESQKSKRRSSRLSKSQEDASSDGIKKMTAGSKDEGRMEARTASGGEPHGGTNRSPRRSSGRRGEKAGRKELFKRSSPSKVASSESVTESIDLDEPVHTDKGSIGHSQLDGSESKGKKNVGGSMTQESLSLLRGENGRSIQTEGERDGAKRKETPTVAVADITSDVTEGRKVDTAKQTRSGKLTKESDERDMSVEETDHPVIATKEKKKNDKAVSSGSTRRQKLRSGDKSDHRLGKNKGGSRHDPQEVLSGTSGDDDTPQRSLRSRQKGKKERKIEQGEESKEDPSNGHSLVEGTPDVEIVDVEELARNYDRTMNSKAGESSPDIFTMHLENSEELQKRNDADSERRKDASQDYITGGENEGEPVQSSRSHKQRKRKRKTFSFGKTDVEERGSTVSNLADEGTQKSDDKVEQDGQEGEKPQNGDENGQSTEDQHVSATLGASASPEDLPAAPLPGHHHLRRRKKNSADVIVKGDRPEESDGSVAVKRTSQRRRGRRQNSGEDTPGTKNKRFCQDLEGASGEMVDAYSAVSPTPPTVGSTPKSASRRNKEIRANVKASEEDADGSKSLVEAFKEIQSQKTKARGAQSQVGTSMGSPSISLLQGVDVLGEMEPDEMGDEETQVENIDSKVEEVRRDGAEVGEDELPSKQIIGTQDEVEEVIEDEAIQEEEEVERKDEVEIEEDGVKMLTDTLNHQKSNAAVRSTETDQDGEQPDGDEDEEIRPETSHIEENADITRSQDDPSNLVQDVDELDGEEPLFDDDYASQDSPVSRHNLTSASSVLSSQSDLMNSQQQENAKETLKKMEREIAEMERALKEEDDGMGERKKDLDVISDESDADDESVEGHQDVVDHDKDEQGEDEDEDDADVVIDGTKDETSKSNDEREKVGGSSATMQKGMKIASSEGETSGPMDRGVRRKSSGRGHQREAPHEEEDVAKIKSNKGVRPETWQLGQSKPSMDEYKKTRIGDGDDDDDVERTIDVRGRKNGSRNRTLTNSSPTNGKKSQVREKSLGAYSRYKDIESIEDEDIAQNVRENLTEMAAAENSFDSLLKKFSEKRRKSEMILEAEQKKDDNDDKDYGSEKRRDENSREVSPTRIIESPDSPRSPSPPPVLSQRTLLKRVSPLPGSIEKAVRITSKRASQEKFPVSQKKRRRVVVEESESEDDEMGIEKAAEHVETAAKPITQQEDCHQTMAVGTSYVQKVEETVQRGAITDKKRKEREGINSPGRSGEGTIRVPQEKPRNQEKVQSPQHVLQTNSPENQQGEQRKKRKRGESMSLIASGLNKQKLKLVEKLCRKAGCRFSSSFSSDTTHVIVNADENLCCERTLKYFQGIAAGKWVISYQWVHDSLSSSRLLPQEKYEIRGDSVNGRNHCGPMRARSWKGPPLLARFNFFCLEPYTGLSKDQLKGLLTSSGGIVYSHPSELPCGTDRENLIIAQSGAQEEEVDYNALYQKHQTKVISREWVLDSIAIFTAQPITTYLLCDILDEGDVELDSDDEF